jgi:23S rRNA (uracil1939-C5)-methyltransferase
VPEKNRVYRARIEGYTSEGLGVARIDGQAVFVHRALRGEDCDVLILKVLKNAAFGKAVRVYEPSPHRVEPDCPYYGRCGGCDFRHMDRTEELAAKRQRVQDALRRIGGSAVTVEGIDGGAPLHYRNKSQYPVAADGSVGFYKARSHQVVPVTQCLIQRPQADAAAQALRTYIASCGVSCYDEKTRRGLVRHLYIRTNGVGQSLICVVANGKKLPREEELVRLLRQAAPETVGVVLGVNTQPTGAVLGTEYRTLWGADVLTDTLCGLTFRLSVPSFYQVNREMAERLYARAVEFAGLTGTETVLDLYCGAGTITQVMARHAGRVIGAEIVPEAIEDAKANAKRNNVENVEFFCGDASAVAADLAARGLRPDVICVDPPRKGLAPEVVRAAAQMAPRRIVYVSCDPATLARDVKLFGQEGYEAVRAAAVDMFPGTANVETVCLLSKLQSKEHIEIEVKMDELDLTSAESKATYEEIKAYVLEHTGLKVSHLYIAQVKQKYGIIERENYNKPKSENAKQPQCPPEKEEAITEALKHFGMIL